MALTRKWEGYKEDWFSAGGGKVNGTSTVVYSGTWGNRKTDSILGNKHPDILISDLLVATSVSIEPWGDASDSLGGPKTAKHTVVYSPNPAATAMSDWMEQWEAGGEAITLGGGFRWSDTNTDIEGTEDSPVKLFPTATIGIAGTTAKFVTAAKTKVLNCVGKINKTAMSIKKHSYPAEHLLFLGLSANQTGARSAGSDTYQLAYKFAYRHDNTWNEFWRNHDSKANHVGFHVLIDDSNNKPYSTANFSDIDPAHW